MNRQVLWIGARHTCSIDPDGVLRKSAHTSHMLLKPPAWCFDAAHIAAAEATGVHAVEVFDQDSKRTYRCDWTTFAAQRFPVDRGHGSQVGLGLRYWTITGPGLSEAVAPQPVPDAPAQLSLW